MSPGLATLAVSEVLSALAPFLCPSQGIIAMPLDKADPDRPDASASELDSRTVKRLSFVVCWGRARYSLARESSPLFLVVRTSSDRLYTSCCHVDSRANHRRTDIDRGRTTLTAAPATVTTVQPLYTPSPPYIPGQCEIADAIHAYKLERGKAP